MHPKQSISFRLHKNTKEKKKQGANQVAVISLLLVINYYIT